MSPSTRPVLRIRFEKFFYRSFYCERVADSSATRYLYTFSRRPERIISRSYGVSRDGTSDEISASVIGRDVRHRINRALAKRNAYGRNSERNKRRRGEKRRRTSATYDTTYPVRWKGQKVYYVSFYKTFSVYPSNSRPSRTTGINIYIYIHTWDGVR